MSWPLELIISETAIRKYNQVMAFLLKLKRAKHGLDRAARWKVSRVPPSHPNCFLLKRAPAALTTYCPTQARNKFDILLSLEKPSLTLVLERFLNGPSLRRIGLSQPFQQNEKSFCVPSEGVGQSHLAAYLMPRGYLLQINGPGSSGGKQRLLFQQKLLHFINTLHQYVMDRVSMYPDSQDLSCLENELWPA